jgi:hypothetical protein
MFPIFFLTEFVLITLLAIKLLVQALTLVEDNAECMWIDDGGWKRSGLAYTHQERQYTSTSPRKEIC